jgi:hypothetical protein
MCCQARETAMVVGESIQFCAQISIVFSLSISSAVNP